VRRIVVAADSSIDGRAALEAAVRLAARLEAEIEGLFVEDVNLKRLSELPVAREIRFGGTFQAHGTGGVLADMRAEAEQTRQALEALATRAQIKVTFRVAEGRVETEVVAAASGADLLILGLTGRRVLQTGRPGTTALAAVMRSTRSVLVLRPGVDITERALALYDGSPGADMALDLAARIAADDGGMLTVVLRAENEAEAQKLRRRAGETLTEYGVNGRYRVAPAPTLNDLCRAVTMAGASVLVISAADPLLAGEGSRRLLEDVACPVLLVR